MNDVRTVWDGSMILGEGPTWDPSGSVLWFVDIKGPQVHRYDPVCGAVTTWDAPERIGWVVPQEDGNLLAGLKSGLARFAPTSGSFDHLVAVEPDDPNNRLNDATVRSDGTVWFGSMDDEEKQPSGRVYRWDGRNVTETGIAPVTVTNGPAFSPDGQTLYCVDTFAGTVFAVPVCEDATVGAPRVFAQIGRADGYPDGVSVDSVGNVWVGLWGGWRVRCYGADGTLRREVPFPVANVTKVAFGGPDLRTVYATTASIGLSVGQRGQQPKAGSLFAFDVDIPGLPLPVARIG